MVSPMDLLVECSTVAGYGTECKQTSFSNYFVSALRVYKLRIKFSFADLPT